METKGKIASVVGIVAAVVSLIGGLFLFDDRYNNATIVL